MVCFNFNFILTFFNFRSTTLEDIYRHYERGRKQDDQDEEKEEEEYDTNIAGYPFQSGQSSKIGHGPTGNVYPYAPGSPYSFPGPPMHSGHGYGLADQNMYGTSHGVDNAVHITYGATGGITQLPRTELN